MTMGPTGCPEPSATTNERCVTLQKNEDPNENRCQTSLSVLVNKTAHVWTANTVHVSEICHWLQVSAYPQVLRPANSTKVFRGFSSVLEQMLSRYPKSTLYCMLLMQPCPKLTSICFHQNAVPPPAPNAIKISS
jgi:hypothetical protein